MTSRIIEECFNLDELEEKIYSKYITFDTGNIMALVVDPYVINIADLQNIKPGGVTLVRVRKPAWGLGDIQKYIYPIRKT